MCVEGIYTPDASCTQYKSCDFLNKSSDYPNERAVFAKISLLQSMFRVGDLGEMSRNTSSAEIFSCSLYYEISYIISTMYTTYFTKKYIGNK